MDPFYRGLNTFINQNRIPSNYTCVLFIINIELNLFHRLGELRHSGNTLNEELETEMYRWAVETIGMTIFGIRLGCLDGSLQPITKYVNKHKLSYILG